MGNNGSDCFCLLREKRKKEAAAWAVLEVAVDVLDVLDVLYP